jgi:hypothetical protein
MLAEKRKLFKEKIKNNPYSLSGVVYPQVDNGYGTMIENRAGVPTAKTYTNQVRIYRVKKAVKQIINNNAVYFYEEIHEMQSDSDTVVDTRLEFTYNAIKFRVKLCEPIIKFGGIIGYQYEIDDITEQEI